MSKAANAMDGTASQRKSKTAQGPLISSWYSAGCNSRHVILDAGKWQVCHGNMCNKESDKHYEILPQRSIKWIRAAVSLEMRS